MIYIEHRNIHTKRHVPIQVYLLTSLLGQDFSLSTYPDSPVTRTLWQPGGECFSVGQTAPRSSRSQRSWPSLCLGPHNYWTPPTGRLAHPSQCSHRDQYSRCYHKPTLTNCTESLSYYLLIKSWEIIYYDLFPWAF